MTGIYLDDHILVFKFRVKQIFVFGLMLQLISGTFKKYCKEKGIDFNEFINADLNKNNQTEMVHFIGKIFCIFI